MFASTRAVVYRFRTRSFLPLTAGAKWKSSSRPAKEEEQQQWHHIDETCPVSHQATIDRLNHKALETVSAIPPGASVLVGGYLHMMVPSDLLAALANANSHDLTLITNASAVCNSELRAILRMPGKVKRLITSLDVNRQLLREIRQLKHPFELSVLSTRLFLLSFCLQSTSAHAGLTEPNRNLSALGEYALVRANQADLSLNLSWMQCGAAFFNDAFARSAAVCTIAQADSLRYDDIHNNNNNYNSKREATEPPPRVSSLFVRSVLVSSSSERAATSNCWTAAAAAAAAAIDTYNADAYDMAYEIIAKRLVLEFQSNDRVFLAGAVRQLVECFYMPKHLRVHLVHALVQRDWPSGAEWLHCAQRTSVCVVRAVRADRHGRMQVRSASADDCCAFDIAENMAEHDPECVRGGGTRLIGVMKLGDMPQADDDGQLVERFLDEDEDEDANADNVDASAANAADNSVAASRRRLQTLRRRADLIITDKGVLRYNPVVKRMQLIEYPADDGRRPDEAVSWFETAATAAQNKYSATSEGADAAAFAFRPYVNKDELKRMRQECY